MLVRIANSEDPDQTASSLGLHCLGLCGWQLALEILEHLRYMGLNARKLSLRLVRLKPHFGTLPYIIFLKFQTLIFYCSHLI